MTAIAHWGRVSREIKTPGGHILGGEKAGGGESGIRLIGVRIFRTSGHWTCVTHRRESLYLYTIKV